MGILLDDQKLQGRRELAAGTLAPLAESLTADLEWAISLPLHSPPKARLTRGGGWCPRDGTLLTFQPGEPHAHRCRRCNQVFRGDDHYTWWAMGWQLWLAERVLHAAVLHALQPDVRRLEWAERVLGGLADSYLTYPNRDNVLGPSRPFFSTYLEALWLLHLCIAVDTLESSSVAAGALDRVRERLIEPSADLIESYNEAGSNRQVWNAAALLAAGRLLGQEARAERAVHAAGGLLFHLRNGLLPDGSWFEGENYHQFAQRGLWYGIALQEAAGGAIPLELEARWRMSAGTIFRTALPDLTIPARRDSQWNVSLRQWRFAEMAELGLARHPGDGPLAGALAMLYDGGARGGDTGRRRSTGEAERNEPGCALTRADLGWRSLLFAPALPPLAAATPSGSVLLPQQGYAILRSDDDRTYAALECGQGGGGHGHPDQLGIVLQRGDARWIQDPGTGSYTDNSLHWFRSTLAHCAPLVDGRTQLRVHGEMRAFDRDGPAQWANGRAEGIAPAVTIERSLIVMPHYMVDELTWSGAGQSYLDLPLHTTLEATAALVWESAELIRGGATDPGYEFLSATERAATPAGTLRLEARSGGECISVFVASAPGVELWRAMAPGPPGETRRRMFLLRIPWATGRVATVWGWGAGDERLKAVDYTSRGGRHRLTVSFADGAAHEHEPVEGIWEVRAVDARHRPVARWSLGAGIASPSPAHASAGEPLAKEPHATAGMPSPHVLPLLPSADAVAAEGLRFALAEPHWRGSEQSWSDAGALWASVSAGVVAGTLVVQVEVAKPDPVFAPHRDTNPLDNEHPDINSDGVQLHLSGIGGSDPHLVWLLVPEPDGEGSVRCTTRTPDAEHVALPARWGVSGRGWWLRAELPLSALQPSDDDPGTEAVAYPAAGAADVPDLEAPRRAADSVPPTTGRDALAFRMDVLVNEISRDRERRRGQLVLSGARGERVWLRGDRQDPAKFLEFRVYG